MSKHILLIMGSIAAITIAATVPAGESPLPALFTTHTPESDEDVIVKPIAPFAQRGIEWLADAQLPNGGWGAGQHNKQDVRDPHAVQVDPATTAFAAMALLRTGSTLTSGPYSANLKKALEIMLEMIGNAPQGNNITSVTGTQPQRKLGQNIDVAMASQFLTKIKPTVQHNDALVRRIDHAMAVCVEKLEQGQNTDGSYMAGGWAPVLQSAMATNALESASAQGYNVDRDKLDKAKGYQRTNLDAASGAVRSSESAGISLYALASTQRASVNEARKVKDALVEEKSINWDNVEEGDLEKHLLQTGMARDEAGMLAEAYVVNRAANRQLQNDEVLSGFGNNGGEEFLSYMMTSESMVATGGKEWDQWHAKMSDLLSSVQNQNGSWSGHHCITSPVFCTAAVILTLTADR